MDKCKAYNSQIDNGSGKISMRGNHFSGPVMGLPCSELPPGAFKVNTEENFHHVTQSTRGKATFQTMPQTSFLH